MAHILIVDDDPDILALLTEMLVQAGHTIDVAENGREALQTLAQTPVDMVMTDIFMPELDGLDLMATLLKAHPRMPIIAMSGGYRAMDPQLTLKMARMFGACEIVSKPFELVVLQQAIARGLQQIA
ncbi:MAG: response regulator [Magnetococcales bacterium]|nr:response regulator [Magnetococcales bacterium]